MSFSAEAVEIIPRFAAEERDIYVRLGCSGCQNAVNLRTVDADSMSLKDLVEPVPNTRVGTSYRFTQSSERCEASKDCPFSKELEHIAKQLLETKED